MRVAVVLAITLFGCASGGKSDNNPDASPGRDAVVIGSDAGTICGGPDQLPCEGVYVAPNGSDLAAGTKGAPLKTIASGIAKAGATGKKNVFVRAGSYTEQVTMSPGITVYGGFDETWTVVANADTEIIGASPVIKFENIAVPTFLDRVTVKANDATTPGASSTAILAIASQGIELRGVTVQAGVGGDGIDGGNGTNSANGIAGTAGRAGCENSGGFCASCS
ncbi:MAG TPA: hypothetical protein VK427_20405, partial [Kofleriaceae bacterium]|nr:hypothetical protein [Kofleriaceae bacterium]